MTKQDYKNHAKYYYPHHFIFYPLIAILAAASVRQGFQHSEHSLEWFAIAVVFALLGWLSFMLRQHYSLTNQNRIIRLEMRLRYYQLTQKRLEDIELRLSFSQLAALRFASDEELPRLVEKTLRDNLSADMIKRAITNWIPDHMRV